MAYRLGRGYAVSSRGACRLDHRTRSIRKKRDINVDKDVWKGPAQHDWQRQNDSIIK